MNKSKFLTLGAVSEAARAVAYKIIAVAAERRMTGPVKLHGVPRGGLSAALFVQAELAKQSYPSLLVDNAWSADVIIDDVEGTGATRTRYLESGKPFFALYRNADHPGEWLVFPWEVGDRDSSKEDIIIRQLQAIGENPNRQGLKETPSRVIKAWGERFGGYNKDPAEVFKTFDDGAEGCDQMVLVSHIPVVSKCEHHIEDILGLAHIAYIPNGKVVGLSKLARLVDVFARRLQVQERLTNQIADAIQTHLQPIGVGVILECSHACMITRGVNIHGSLTTTSALRGALKEEPSARAEFMQLVAGARAARSN